MKLSRREFLKYPAGATGIVMLCSGGKAAASDRADSNGRGKAVLTVSPGYNACNPGPGGLNVLPALDRDSCIGGAGGRCPTGGMAGPSSPAITGYEKAVEVKA